MRRDSEAKAGDRAIKREAKRTVVVRDEPLEEDGVRAPIPDRVEQLLPATPYGVAPVIAVPGVHPLISRHADDQSISQMDLGSNFDDELKNAYQEEVKAEAERKRKADADERLRRGEAYVRLAKIAKGKMDPVPVQPSPRKKVFGVTLPSLPSWGSGV